MNIMKIIKKMLNKKPMNSILIINHLFQMKVKKGMMQIKMESKKLGKNTMIKIIKIRSLHKEVKRKNVNVD